MWGGIIAIQGLVKVNVVHWKTYFCLSMQKLHIILQKEMFFCRKKETKQKQNKKKHRDRLKNYLLFIVKFCCGDDWRAASPTTLPKCSKLSNPRYFILMKCFPICVLRVMKIPSDDDFNNYFQFYSSLWCLIRVSIAVPRVKLQWQP